MKNIFATAASVLVLGFAVPAMAQSNTSTINQLGYSQSATVDQLGNLANNSSGVYQGLNWSGSAGNDAKVKQAGTNAIANTSTVIQDGYNNKAKIEQSGDGNGGDYNLSYAKQYGYGNEVDVLQGDLATNNTSVIDQYGNGNKAIVKQGGGEGGNLVNYSNIDQDGSLNTATVLQGGVNTVANTSFVTQNGGGNVANVNQH